MNLRMELLDHVLILDFPHALVVKKKKKKKKKPPASRGDIRDAGLVPGLGRSPGGGQATHSSIFAWRIPWTEEPGEL